MDAINILLIIISIFNLFLAVLISNRGSKKTANSFFKLFIIGASAWSFSIAAFRFSGDLQFVRYSAYLIYLSGTLVPISFLFFVKAFINNKIQFSAGNLAYLIWPVALIIIIFIPEIFIKEILIEGANKSVILGFGYISWVLYFCFYMFLGLFWLSREFFRSKGMVKLQLSYIIMAIFFPFLGSLPFNIFLPFSGNYQFIFVGPLSLMVMVGIVTYAIAVHRLLDIRFVAARVVAYTVLLIFISVCYAGAIFLLSSQFFGSEIKTDYLIAYTALTVLVALSFDRLRLFFENATDGIFFRGIYKSDELLAHLGSIMSTNIELGPLSAQIIQTIIDQMRISKAAFVILGEDKSSIYDVIEIGFPNKLFLSYNQISAFIPHSQTVILDELGEDSLKELMCGMDVSLIKTLTVKGEPIALLLLGAKSSGGVYSQQDIKVLEILSPEMAVAISNSLSYDKIKKFNVLLYDEVKKATSDLEKANIRLKQLDKLKDDFVSIASHELRTPMTAIRSYAWMALHRSDVPLSKNLEKYLARILLSTERAINLVNDMLNVSRIEAGRIEINPSAVDLISLIKDIVDETYYSKSQEKNIQFAVLEKPIPKVFADPEKLRQVFLNLVGNALKFTPNGGKIIFDFFTDGKVVEISVSDTGVGISKDDLSKLFHKFARLDSSYTATAASGGSGLGLYISKNLVELMHGKIRVRSEGMGKGTTFTVTMSVATPDLMIHAGEYAVKPVGEVKGLETVAV